MDKLKNINDLEVQTSNDEIVEVPIGITSNNTNLTCKVLYDMHISGQVEVQPDFQRNFVWNNEIQTKFIDSLAKHMPLPVLFLAKDYKTDKSKVIDGLQRFSTIIKFFKEGKWRLKKLPDINQNISGKSISTIEKNFKKVYQKIENAPIPVITINCDFSDPSHMDYLFEIFNRLNTGGQKLKYQEIRNCIYSGNFNQLLKKIAKSDEWKNIFGTSNTDRYDNEELVLRIFAFNEKLDEYTGNLAKFLSSYMSEKKDISDDELKAKEEMLHSSISFISDKIDNKTVKDFSKAKKEGLLVGVSSNINKIKSKTKMEIQPMFNTFNSDELFKKENLSQGLSDKGKVQERLNKSIQIFGA